MNMKRFTALLLALLLTVPFAFAGETAADRTLATVGEVQIKQSDVDLLMPTFVNQQYVADESDYQTVVEYLVHQELLKKKTAEMKMDQFTPEEETALRNEADKEWEKGLDEYVTYYLSEDTEAARAECRKQGEAYYQSRGVTKDLLYQNRLTKAAIDKMSDYLMGGYEPTAEEVDQVFQAVGAQYQAAYENDIPNYEYMTKYYGQKCWYTPNGYRGIIHILIKPEAEVLEHFTAMQAAYEEQKLASEKPADATASPAEATADPSATAEASVVKEAVTLEQVEEARQAVIDSKKTVVNEIYDRLEKGESFEKLIEEYGEDPGMQSEENLRDGYAVHEKSVIYDPAFSTAAFSEKMRKVGDVSLPAVGSFGIHILKYQRDIPSGLQMTDDVNHDITEYLKSQKQNEVFTQAYKLWETEIAVTYNTASIKAASEEATARLNQENTDENEDKTQNTSPEAVPSQDGKPAGQ